MGDTGACRPCFRGLAGPLLHVVAWSGGMMGCTPLLGCGRGCALQVAGHGDRHMSCGHRMAITKAPKVEGVVWSLLAQFAGLSVSWLQVVHAFTPGP